MFETFAYKRYKKHKLGKETAKEALDKKDEAFIRKSLDEHQTTPSPPSVNPLFRLLHRKSSNGKKADGEGTHTAPTEAELAALKVKDSGITIWEEGLIVGTTTPTSQEEDLSRVLNSLNMAVSKVSLPIPPFPSLLCSTSLIHISSSQVSQTYIRKPPSPSPKKPALS